MLRIGQALPPLTIVWRGKPTTTAQLRARQNLLFAPCQPDCPRCARYFAELAAASELEYWELDRWWVTEAGAAAPGDVPAAQVIEDVAGRCRAWLGAAPGTPVIAVLAVGMELKARWHIAKHEFLATEALAGVAAEEALRCPE